tara:strand:- start:1225 stop:1446 length:222 start_codon:yes stop_codon:yes gene_type:complete
MKKLTQNERVIKYLSQGNVITSLDAWKELGIMRLASRIYDIKRQGVAIHKEQITVQNRFGEKCTVAQWSMPNG